MGGHTYIYSIVLTLDSKTGQSQNGLCRFLEPAKLVFHRSPPSLAMHLVGSPLGMRLDRFCPSVETSYVGNSFPFFERSPWEPLPIFFCIIYLYLILKRQNCSPPIFSSSLPLTNYVNKETASVYNPNQIDFFGFKSLCG